MRAWLDSLLGHVKMLKFWGNTVAIIRLNGILVLSVAAACIIILARPNPDLPTFFDPQSFFETFALLLLAVISFYLLAVILPYLWFFLNYYLLRNQRNQILFKFPKDTCDFGEEFTVDAILQKKMRLLFGVIKFRLVFFNYDTTDWYFLMRSQKRRGVLFQSAERGAIGSFGMHFRHLGRFRTRYSVVKFEDPLGLFSFPIIEKEYDHLDPEKNFYIYSVPALPSHEIAPYYIIKRKVAQSSEQSYRVTEDFFDTKRYEPSDDSRRMLWQVYSRTRQLLVRIPDRDSSIEADIDVYLLFYNSLFVRDNETFRTLFDTYIQDIAAFLQSLMVSRPLNVFIYCDSHTPMPYRFDPQLTQAENIRRGMVSNYWHRDVTPVDYIRHINAQRSPDRERLLILNPYINPNVVPTSELSQFTLVRMLGKETQIDHPIAVQKHWFIKPERQERAALRAFVSRNIRKKIARNTEALSAVLPEGGARGAR